MRYSFFISMLTSTHGTSSIADPPTKSKNLMLALFSAAAVKRIVLFRPQSIAGERVWLTERGAELFA
jgi:hypothetical protein